MPGPYRLSAVSRRLCLPLALVLAGHFAFADEPVSLSSGLKRMAGEDAPSKINYVRLFLDGKLLDEHGIAVPLTPNISPPALIAQCTQSPSGKLAFELLANFGGVDDLAYYPPWDKARDGGMFAPQLEHVGVTMEFLGYTHVKPVKRQWEVLLQPAGQLRYNRPGVGSPNMEDSTYYLRYLLALPTLRLRYSGKAAEFETTPLLNQIKKETVCKAAGL
jgi:hypothetical protein